MVTLPVYDRNGAEVGKIDIDPAAIAPKINKQLLHDAVVMYLANKRQGTKKTKGRGEVSGSTRKLYRQKGTGNARVGSRRAPQRRGGGHAMQIKPRTYYYRLPKKAIRAATKMAIASKIADSEVVVIDQLEMAAPKTKELAEVLKALGLEGQTTLVATSDYKSEVYKSARNIPGVEVTRVIDLNALAVIRPKRLLITKEALELIKSQAADTSAA
ncbi:50S ribosomal protein L4 [Aureliella helgolandensis]|uniref:Large ribosomal subunit protein uL4 n=1 Tax=Aureliella helgolandensis TaxID=2527968 RepID=A0A518G241_9BACT|nr:50S ribosomal protein L4 [Aureliella helgolandensis]QDV22644.1 50S ribosomal protein L4 [Aureliella helgolandensis]